MVTRPLPSGSQTSGDGSAIARLDLTPARLVTVAAAVLAALVVVPLVLAGQPYFLNVLTNAAILSFISLGVWVTFSIGRINIAQGAFAMIGGYTTAILSTRYGLSFWLCLPLSALVAAAIGAMIGWPILRLRGVYFAMITLSLTEAVRLAFLNGGEFTQGASGIVNIPRPAGIDSPVAFYELAVVLLLLGLLAVWRLSTSRIGWVFRSLRLNEELACSIGIDIARYRIIAFAFSCALGGVGGAFFATFHQNIYPASYSVIDSVNFMLYCFLGGLDYVLGPVVGAFLLVIGFEVLQELQEYQSLMYGILMIAVILWLPNGILSLRLRGRERAEPDQGVKVPAKAAGATSGRTSG
jgi:branched-chain amino acid transport system permease protein